MTKRILLTGGAGFISSAVVDYLVHKLVNLDKQAIAYHQGWLSAEQLARQAEALSKTGYGQYLERLFAQEAAQ